MCSFIDILQWKFRTIGWFLMLKVDFENQILALFDVYFWPFNKSHEKINGDPQLFTVDVGGLAQRCYFWFCICISFILPAFYRKVSQRNWCKLHTVPNHRHLLRILVDNCLFYYCLPHFQFFTTTRTNSRSMILSLLVFSRYVSKSKNLGSWF